MGHRATAWAWRQPVATSTMRLVLLALADYAGDDGKAYPSQLTLAERTVLTDRSVRAALAQLEAAGFIERKKRGSRAKGRTSDLITLAIHVEVVTGLTTRNQLPPNRHLPEKNVVFTGSTFRGTCQEPYPSQVEQLSTSNVVALRARPAPGWDDDAPFKIGGAA